MKRYICSLIGCRLNDWLLCKRCGTHLYDGGYDRPCETLRALESAWWSVKTWIAGKTCEVCGRRFWSSRNWTCSTKCADEWIPF